MKQFKLLLINQQITRTWPIFQKKKKKKNKPSTENSFPSLPSVARSHGQNTLELYNPAPRRKKNRRPLDKPSPIETASGPERRNFSSLAEAINRSAVIKVREGVRSAARLSIAGGVAGNKLSWVYWYGKFDFELDFHGTRSKAK